MIEHHSSSALLAQQLLKPSDTFWKEKIEEMGGDFVLWSNAPENPNYN